MLPRGFIPGLAAASLVLAACAAAPEKGLVVSRRITPPHTTYSQSCTAWHKVTTTTRVGGQTKKKTTTACVAWRTIPHNTPAYYYLRLQDGDEVGDRLVYPVEYGACWEGRTYPDCTHPATPEPGEWS